MVLIWMLALTVAVIVLWVRVGAILRVCEAAAALRPASRNRKP